MNPASFLVLLAFQAAPAPTPITPADLRHVGLADLEFSHREKQDVLQETASGRLDLYTAELRATLRKTARPDRQGAELRVVYLGPTAEVTKLASGNVRTQIGLKLRAADTCNVVYVMWRIQPDEGIVVMVKKNPGKKVHAQCGAEGYQRVRPERLVKVAPPEPGVEHTMRVELVRESLVVTVDDAVAWQGALPEPARDLKGPLGLRIDNGHFLVDWKATFK
jgi:hypothetical protein